MDIRQYFRSWLASVQQAFASGELVAPLSLALAALVLLLLRGWILICVLKTFGLQEPALENTVKKKLDQPLQTLLILSMILPFISFLKNGFGIVLGYAVTFSVLFLFLSVIISVFDLLVFDWYLTRKKGTNVPAVVRVVAVGIFYVAAILFALDVVFGVSVLPFLATSTVMAAVLGLALQDTLKNICAGLTISLENNFRSGDWIMIRIAPDRYWTGQIIDIGWRSTKIRTPDGNYAIIPNVQFTTQELINYSSIVQQYSCTLEIPAQAKSDSGKIIAALIKAAEETENVLDNPAPSAHLLAIKPDHALYQLRFWLKNFEDRDRASSEVLEHCLHQLARLLALPSK